jgi:hypothetical protein
MEGATLETKLMASDGEIMEVWRAGKNDYWVNFIMGECSVRGTLAQVMNEIYSIYEDVEEV